MIDSFQYSNKKTDKINSYQLRMNYSSTSGRKSKYEESSKKVSQLYFEFQQIQQRINTPKQQIGSFNDIFAPPLPARSSQKKQEQKQKINRSMEMGYRVSEQLENKYMLRKKFQKYLAQHVHDLTFKTREKIFYVEKKLSHIQMGLKLILDRIKLRVKHSKIECDCLFDGMNAKQISETYEQKIKDLVQVYEHKISLLMKQTSSHETSVSSKVISVDKKLIKNTQQDSIVKQKQVKELKLQNSKLRRQNEKISELLSTKEKLINQLTEQIDQKKRQLSNIAQNLKQYQNQNKMLKRIGNFGSFRNSSGLLNFIQRKTSQSQFNPRYLEVQKQLKAKKAQIELLIQEGAANELEKNRFQQQVKQYQADEEKFQKQSQIFKSQIKRMNLCIKTLDDCAVKILLQGKLPPQWFKTLDPQLKLKRQYEKKLNQRSDSRNSRKK